MLVIKQCGKTTSLRIKMQSHMNQMTIAISICTHAMQCTVQYCKVSICLSVCPSVCHNTVFSQNSYFVETVALMHSSDAASVLTSGIVKSYS